MAAASADLGLLANVKVRMTVEVGRAQITIEDLLRLSEGAVVELDRLAGDPLDILVNGTRIATGEVVVVGGRFGIRFGEVVDPTRHAEQA
jgi:flagellar motor switch protein FliN/FliY